MRSSTVLPLWKRSAEGGQWGVKEQIMTDVGMTPHPTGSRVCLSPSPSGKGGETTRLRASNNRRDDSKPFCACGHGTAVKVCARPVNGGMSRGRNKKPPVVYAARIGPEIQKDLRCQEVIFIQIFCGRNTYSSSFGAFRGVGELSAGVVSGAPSSLSLPR